MGDWIKRALLLALAAAAAWKGWRYWRGRDAVHRLAFRVEGPPSCGVAIRYGTADAPRDEQRWLAWEGGEVEARGHVEAKLSVDVPLACNWQPSQVRCFVDRDGAPWKQAEATRVTNPANGELTGLRCEVSAPVWE